MPFSTLYVSDLAEGTFGASPEEVRAGLMALQDAATQKNRALNVRGLLVCGATFFVQWLEGEEPVVRGLLAQIASDPRHRNVQVLFEGNAPRMLDEWSMTLLSRAVADPAVEDYVRQLRTDPPVGEDGYLPAMVVRRLVKPDPASHQRQRIGLFGQNGIWSSALASHLGDRWGATLHRARLLGSSGFEREALIEHLDHHDPAFGSLSVINYSADLLAAAWMQGCVAPLKLAVLFFSGNTGDSVAEFAHTAVAQLQTANRQVRLVCLFGRSAYRHRAAAEQVLRAFTPSLHVAEVTLADSAAVWQEISRHLEPAPVRAQEIAPRSEAPCPFDHVLSIEGVAAVGLVPGGGQGPPRLRLKAPGDSGRGYSEEFRAWSEGHGLGGPPGDAVGSMVVRWQERITFLQPLDDSGELLYVATEPGVTNESWLRLQLDAALAETRNAGTPRIQ